MGFFYCRLYFALTGFVEPSLLDVNCKTGETIVTIQTTKEVSGRHHSFNLLDTKKLLTIFVKIKNLEQLLLTVLHTTD